MNIVIYARYSSHNQTEMSIEGQLKVCHEYAAKNNYSVIHEYIDRAMTGTNDNRPQFLKMIEDSKKRLFEVVLVYQFDRFARNRFDSARYKNDLKKNGVRVISANEYIPDDASGVLMESVLEGMAEYYSRELSQKILREMTLKAEKCLYVGGGVPLGYKVNPDKTFSIDEQNAFFVKKIFEMYAQDYSMKQICDYMNGQHVKTGRNGEFNKNSLPRILNNRRYLGIYTYNDEEIQDGMPRIISDELFEQVQEKLIKNKKAPARARAKDEYILTTKLFCGYCKQMMTGQSGTSHVKNKKYYYYVCKEALQKRCHKKRVRKEYIENLVIDKCLKLLTDENIEIIAREVEKTFKDGQDDYELKRLNKLLKENQFAIENLIKALELGQISDIITEKIGARKKEQDAIKQQIAIEENKVYRLTYDEIKFFLTQLKNKKANDLKYRRTLVYIFVNKIYLYDGRIIFIMNTGDKETVIDETLLNDIEIATSSHIEDCGRPKKTKGKSLSSFCFLGTESAFL